MKDILKFKNYLIRSFIFLLGLTPLSAQSVYFNWAGNFSGASAGADLGYCITVDVSGNVYTTGSFGSIVDFDPGPGTFCLTASGNSDIFISKLDASGNFVWARSMGGSAAVLEFGTSITVDALGNTYTTGRYVGTVDFDPGTGTFNISSSSGYGIFVLKLDVSGNFVWAKSIGGFYNHQSYSIVIDLSGNINIIGTFEGTVDFDPGAGTMNLTATHFDCFILKLDTSGNFVWAKNMGGTGPVWGTSIALDAFNNVYATGNYSGTVDFDPGAGTFNLTSLGGINFFISKLNTNGNFVWTKSFGGTMSDSYSNSIALDVLGNIYTTGGFDGTIDFDPGVGTFNLTATGTEDLFISKLDTSGTFVWSKSVGGTSPTTGNSIALDAFNNIYATGNFSGTVDFDPGAGTFNLTSLGGTNFFISKLNTNGNFVWTKSIGGAMSDSYSNSIALDVLGNIYTTGGFDGTIDFDPDTGTCNLTSMGGDIFVHKMGVSPVGFVEQTRINNIHIYPNPTNGGLCISSQNSSLLSSFKIINAIGQLVIEKIVENETDVHIDLSDQPTGIYFVETKQGESISRSKIMKN